MGKAEWTRPRSAMKWHFWRDGSELSACKTWHRNALQRSPLKQQVPGSDEQKCKRCLAAMASEIVSVPRWLLIDLLERVKSAGSDNLDEAWDAWLHGLKTEGASDAR